MLEHYLFLTPVYGARLALRKIVVYIQHSERVCFPTVFCGRLYLLRMASIETSSHMIFIQYDFDTPPTEKQDLFPLLESGQVCDLADLILCDSEGEVIKDDRLPPACLGTCVFGGLGHHVRRVRLMLSHKERT